MMTSFMNSASDCHDYKRTCGANMIININVLEKDKPLSKIQHSFFRFSEKWVEPWRTELSSGLTTFGKTRSILHAHCTMCIAYKKIVISKLQTVQKTAFHRWKNGKVIWAMAKITSVFTEKSWASSLHYLQMNICTAGLYGWRECACDAAREAEGRNCYARAPWHPEKSSHIPRLRKGHTY